MFSDDCAPQTPLKTPRRRANTHGNVEILSLGFNALSLSPSKSLDPNDSLNPFLAPPSKPRAPSPVRRQKHGRSNTLSAAVGGRKIDVTDALANEARQGILGKGGLESKYDSINITHDWPIMRGKTEMRTGSMAARSKASHTALSFDKPLGADDRFVPSRPVTDSVMGSATLPSIAAAQATSNTAAVSPGHAARLTASLALPTASQRILTYREAPPLPATDSTLALQRSLAQSLHTRQGQGGGSSDGPVPTSRRKISDKPERILDAPGLMDDFYLNLLAWSSGNILAIALGECVYLWAAETGQVTLLSTGPCDPVTQQPITHVTGLDWSLDAAYLGISYANGAIELWDIDSGTKLRSMIGRQGQVACLAWNQHVLASGCVDGAIWMHDTRVAAHKISELIGHTSEICGLKWQPANSNGSGGGMLGLLASGGNDNVVNAWDSRVGSSNASTTANARAQPKWTKRNHTAAVKALAWCPWQPNLLATGGGTGDAMIHFWSSTSGARINSLSTPGQVTSIVWSQHSKEILSTHGFPHNAVMVHSYPGMGKITEIKDAHDTRVLFSAASPNGDMVATGAGDENLKFWKIWELPKKTAVRKREEESRRTSVSKAIR
ncbi:Cell division cycle 20,5, cofactor of APC complex [Ceratobasidium theobromae]|uniref:Cell division cycle 20,5, cofactor of APC complex n=1 Tax=Ceratobasidium theobromae TaxID=1582974 RepID=A0A5N5QMJ8_9AGAM|nr:Cell division cycle 20,5, cofactor of APC complex [Ceratobasidium theobromae]